MSPPGFSATWTTTAEPMRFADRREAGRASVGWSPPTTQRNRWSLPSHVEVCRSGSKSPKPWAVSSMCWSFEKSGGALYPELAMGAVAEGDVVIRNQEIIDRVGIDDETFDARAESEKSELDSRLARYREAVPAIDPAGRTVVVVDDGLATGSTALAAMRCGCAPVMRSAFGWRFRLRRLMRSP